MTKYVLHGGFDPKKAPVQQNDPFFAEILKDAPKDVKILLVYFAERPEMVDIRIEQDKTSFTKNTELKNLEFKVASAESFINDCVWADVIYLHGGSTQRLMEVLKKYQNIGQAFSGKTIAADSAGVNALSQLFYSRNSKQIGEGLRILPVKTVVHYVGDVPNPLAAVEPNLETLFLREYETKVFYN